MATVPTTMRPRREMEEVKAPEQFQFNKIGQVLSGVLLSIEPVVIKGKETAEYLFEGENGVRATCLETADLKKKIHPGLFGFWLDITYERDDNSFQKSGQSAMKVFTVRKSKQKEPGY